MKKESIQINSKLNIDKFSFININCIAGKIFQNDYMIIDFNKLIINHNFSESILKIELSHIGIGCVCYMRQNEMDRIIGVDTSLLDIEYQKHIVNQNLKKYGFSMSYKDNKKEDNDKVEKEHTYPLLYKSTFSFKDIESILYIDLSTINIDQNYLIKKKSCFPKDIKFYPLMNLFESEINSEEVNLLENGDLLIVKPKKTF